MEFMKVDQDRAGIPNLKLLSISCSFAKNSETGVQEIVALSAVTVDNYNLENQNQEKNIEKFSAVRPFHSHIIPYGFDKSQVQESEFALINYFLSKLGKFDPDVIVGHYLYNEIFELLINRMQKLNISIASKLGRLKKNLGRLGGGILNKARALSQGRLLCDTFLSAKEVIKENDFSLSFLAEKHIDHAYKEIE